MAAVGKAGGALHCRALAQAYRGAADPRPGLAPDCCPPRGRTPMFRPISLFEWSAGVADSHAAAGAAARERAVEDGPDRALWDDSIRARVLSRVRVARAARGLDRGTESRGIARQAAVVKDQFLVWFGFRWTLLPARLRGATAS